MEVNVSSCLSLLVYIFTFLLGLPANLLVLFVYVRKARKHGATPNVVYALNLCVANLALVSWMPIKVTEMVLRGWKLPAAVCPVYSFFLFSSLYGSSLLLTAVVVGRYLSIAYPITYKIYRRARTSCLVSAILWALVIVHLGLALIAEGGGQFVSFSELNASSCYENFTYEQLKFLVPLRLEMSLALFLVPLIVSAFCTLRCVVLVRRSCLSSVGKRRVLVVALSTLAVLVVCYGPYNISHVVGFVLYTNVEWRSEAMLTSSCNVFLEPVIMLMMSPWTPKDLVDRLCNRRGTKSSYRSWHQGNGKGSSRNLQGTAQGVTTKTRQERV
ncbi:free fatty acid receptor 2 [Triplophysa rosa]|uniref:Free fatty acid receptor 2-like n=1 Tax=Triplophysa rosa TaxID=992332 RepID=A0A9W7TMY7_TRIRA|nr:free fatty acid receptor 2 [Triplophysa rosa]KAI7798997.1 putative free fatty acid receptor 2-like [Triplophysa rosa]